MKPMTADARRENLQKLIDARFAGNRSAAAQALGLTSGRITQLLDVNEAFGERAARSIERKLKLPELALEDYGHGDQAREPAPAWSAPSPPSLRDALAVVVDAILAAPPMRIASVRAQLEHLASHPLMRDEVLAELEALLTPTANARHPPRG